MLTKSEAKRLLNDIWILIVNTPGTLVGIDKIIDVIKDFTISDDDREIKVGDIYKNFEGRIERVTGIKNSMIYTDSAEYALNGRYYADDAYLTENNHPDDLDLSKRYKLVEIEDE